MTKEPREGGEMEEAGGNECRYGGVKNKKCLWMIRGDEGNDDVKYPRI